MLLPILAPGFDAPHLALAADLMGVVMPGVVLNGLVYVGAAVLNARGRFLFPALAPAIGNLGMLITMLAVPQATVHGWATGYLVGAFVASILVVGLASADEALHTPAFDWNGSGFRTAVRAAIPLMLITAVLQASGILVRLVASTLEPGTITALSFALTLTNIPLGLFGYALATALVPAFALSLLGNRERFQALFEASTRSLFLLMAPISFVLIALQEPLVRALFERGVFDARATRLTAESLGVYALSLLAQPLIVVAHRALVGASLTTRIARIEMLSTFVLVTLTLILAPRWAHIGVAAAFTLTTAFSAVLYGASVRSSLGINAGPQLLRFAARITPIALISAFAAWFLSMLFPVEGGDVIRLASVAAGGSGAGLTFVVLVHIVRIPEMDRIVALVVAPLRRR
jgi:putative peptidoglycan lipid II flippase